ncbi:DUF445 domain-containing protein [Salibacterium halotolerans]|uniref:Uncharacterized membrane protein YheB, UPF0754 family n=1 Tax=Salibacterium halotolerans TaxID=1884432 RepID=A0A1I5UI11_9BACI|nr:DUF445 family protein [Salibacterium halotolerans]SFP94921.1 Uncharacterized membrane protein YheB, UPF0754 family [Salibacterium halotolerans]
METLVMIVVMAAVGSLIGGVTNSLAIRMLFRPFQPAYIGNLRLPFTPGLIPKRRHEMAEQIGKMVVTHLLTPESLRQKLKKSDFHDSLQNWLAEEVSTFLHQSSTLRDIAEKTAGRKLHLEDKGRVYAKRSMDEWLEKNKNKPLQDVIPDAVTAKGDHLIPVFAARITAKGADYFRGDEGALQLERLLNKFLQGKGSMMNFLGSMFGSDRIVEKLQPEIVRFLEDDTSKKFVENMLQQEWTKWKQKPLSSIQSYIDTNTVSSELVSFLIRELPALEYLDRPLSEWAPSYKDVIAGRWLPAAVGRIQSFLIDRLPGLLERLNLDEVVTEQVNTFSVERLEEMVLSISRREFKMITYLGAVLGGIVGLFQGVIVVLFSIG